MNKQAAEKIASEYYEAGIKLAHDKMASRMHKLFNAIIGGGAGLGIAGAHGGQFRGALGDSSNYLRDIFNRSDSFKALKGAEAELAHVKNWFQPSHPTYTDALAQVEKLKSGLGSELSGLEQLADNAPALALAGGIGTGVYKGLGKLDKKLKLY